MSAIILPYPPSANRYWRIYRGQAVKSDEARKYQDEAGWCARAAGAELIDGDVAIELRVYRPQKRGDLDNRIKVLLDSMQGILFDDDSQVRELHAYLGDDRNAPRVEVIAWGIEQMAVAGGAVPAFLLCIVDGRLSIVGGSQLIQKSVTEDDPAEAVAILRQGRSVYLRAQGNNLADVKEMLKG